MLLYPVTLLVIDPVLCCESTSCSPCIDALCSITIAQVMRTNARVDDVFASFGLCDVARERGRGGTVEHCHLSGQPPIPASTPPMFPWRPKRCSCGQWSCLPSLARFHGAHPELPLLLCCDFSDHVAPTEATHFSYLCFAVSSVISPHLLKPRFVPRGLVAGTWLREHVYGCYRALRGSRSYL